MRNQLLQTISLILAVLAALTTVSVGIYMAQPWGDNYAYQSVSGYAVLMLFLFWALAPYIYLIWQSLQKQPTDRLVFAALVSSVVVCVGGVVLLIDTAFVNMDAQGGAILMFLPIYQWLVIGVCLTISALWGFLKAT